jgi:hypothetical protein
MLNVAVSPKGRVNGILRYQQKSRTTSANRTSTFARRHKPNCNSTPHAYATTQALCHGALCECQESARDGLTLAHPELLEQATVIASR